MLRASAPMRNLAARVTLFIVCISSMTRSLLCVSIHATFLFFSV
jgi:hypothetical protein